MDIAAQLNRWIEIDTDRIAANCMEVRRHIGDGVKFMAVVKANAYGFGAAETVKVVTEYADMLAVTTAEEGAELREAGVSKPILVLASAIVSQLPFYIKYSLIPAIDNEEVLLALNAAEGDEHGFHLIIDTGMNRLGMDSEQGLELLHRAASLPNVKVEGVFSHLACAADKASALKQIEIFDKFLKTAREQGLHYGLAHIANSAAIVGLPQAYFDMVRAGTILYGQAPCVLPADWKLQDPWSVKAKIIAMQEVAPGESIGYGGDYKAKKAMKIAVVPIGYADGFTMEPHARTATFGSAFKDMCNAIGRVVLKKPRYFALYKGHKLPIIGRVSMQLTIIEAVGDMHIGSVIELPMRRVASNPLLARAYAKDGEIYAIDAIAGNTIALANN